MKIENIKFKAKRLDNGKWVIGDLSHSYENGAIIVSTEEGVFQVDPKTVCEPTGIYDKDGKEVFENDIIQNIQSKAISFVLFNAIRDCYSFITPKKRACGWTVKNLADYPIKNFLIIGNLFDRKENEI